ncbi:hypothetical protein EIN_503140 [Entamoeba invadens IP1]|uniref:Uncharacterized protein n=1 Tax=Entamoeba invadens IP1 TaxID=370355 RepID=A0A0A1UD71_ENTIV|nr:hypothetical protein EIN_503140 [Entamoeba invadens IP1]ELP90268.1 hypothetical protein EIN_503140 [Entamoeba invadens IP1]|eukprot:XP_004257039.1 hypothetical protein EIN_503140 [Entamoeba invadens IP1]
MESPIDTLLKDPMCTLEKLMDVEDFSREMKTNAKLIEYCSTPQRLQSIIQYSLCDIPSSQTRESVLKYHYICSSLFSDEVSHIIDPIAQSTDIVRYLFDSLNTPNVTKMSNAAVILSSAISVDNSFVLEYLNTNDDVITILITHLEVDGVLELLLEAIKLEDINKNGTIDQVCRLGLIEALFKTLQSHPSLDALDNITAFVHNLVIWKISNSDSYTSKFVTKINESPELNQFVHFAFTTQDDFVAAQCLQIISNILACSTVLTYKDQVTLPGIYVALIQHLSQFEEIFVKRKIGTLTNNLVYIVLSLVLSGYDKVHEEITRQTVLKSMIAVFYGAHSSTVVRQTVQITVASILSSGTTCLKVNLLDGGNLLDLMVQKDKEALEEKEKKNIAPDYWLIGEKMMIGFYHFIEDKDEQNEVKEIIEKNAEFVNYMKNVVMVREDYKSGYFGKIAQGEEFTDEIDFDDGFEEFEEDEE